MIILKSKRELEKMRQAGQIVALTMAQVVEAVRPGVTTSELNAIAESAIVAAGATPSFKGYRGFPASLCTSVNAEVVHGIPGDYRLSDGDILSLDVGAIHRGFHGDMATTVAVGNVAPEVLLLLEAGKQTLLEGICRAQPGGHLSDISHAIQTFAEAAGYSVVTDYTGHGIGRDMHEDPQVLNYGPSGHGPVLKPGMVLAIEPMLNAGGAQVRVVDDGWTVVTVDGSLSVHFEHTVAITDRGPEILTWVDADL